MKISTAERLQRLISIISWINAHDGPTVDEVCARFHIPPAELLAQLDMAMLIGEDTESGNPMPIDVYYDEDRVFVHLSAFQRPLRLTPEQALALVAAGEAGRSTDPDPDGPLARAVTKVAGVLGIDPADTVEVDLGEADAAVLTQLRVAVADHHAVTLDYTSAARDSRSHRVVEPWRVFNEAGAWYLQARCRTAEGERVFRVDRMHAVTTLDETFAPPRSIPDAAAYRAAADDPRIVLDLAPEAHWVATTYPIDRADQRSGGWLRVTMPAGSPAFLARLLIILGPSAVLVEDERVGVQALVAETAGRMLARYRSPD